MENEQKQPAAESPQDSTASENEMTIAEEQNAAIRSKDGDTSALAEEDLAA